MSKSFYIASGFKEDCNKLLSSFNETNSIRFEKFCEVWKDMKFAMIYAGRQTYSELLEYCEEVLHIAKEFALPPRNFKERIGGLYLLYGLYYKMPIKNVSLIRVTQEQWSSFMELHEQLKAGEHLDANFILSTMIHDEVFAHTIFDFEWGLEKFYREKQTPASKLSIMPSLLELTEQGSCLLELENLSKEYRQATSSIIGASSNLKLFDENFVDDILLDIRKLESNNYNERANETSNDTNNLRIEQRRRRDADKQKNSKVRSRIGDGFDMDTSDEDDINHHHHHHHRDHDDDDDYYDEDDEEVFEPLENYDPNLAETFDDDMEIDSKTKSVKFVEVTLPVVNVKFEHGEGSSD